MSGVLGAQTREAAIREAAAKASPEGFAASACLRAGVDEGMAALREALLAPDSIERAARALWEHDGDVGKPLPEMGLGWDEIADWRKAEYRDKAVVVLRAALGEADT